jgi:Ca-activated chloride channel homolog
MRARLSLAFAFAPALLMIAPVSAQLIIDRRPEIPIARAFEITEVALNATVREQVAQVQVTQVFRNPGPTQIEAEYLFPLPEEGAVQDLVLMVDGKEMPGKVLGKDEARRIYEGIVRAKRDPALLEYMGRGLFKTSVFPIPAGQHRSVTLKVTYLCRRDRDIVEFAYPLSSQRHTYKPIGKLSLNIAIESADGLKTLYSPTHNITIERPAENRAVIRYEARNTMPDADFKLFYTLTKGPVGATVLSYRPNEREDGYFLLLASPAVKTEASKPIPKTVVLVLDRSGSMSGKKIEQACEALRFVINNLRDDDTFNIIAYDNNIEPFRPELQRYSPQARKDALAFVDNIRPGGSTNIDEALKTALGMLQDKTRPSYVLFLTDGLPTAGEQKETAIADNAKAANKVNARLFAFGVGYDVNSRLLDRLSGAAGGVSEYVKPEDNLETAVSRFYTRLSSPVLTGIKVAFVGTDVNRTYPEQLPDLFEGGQLVWVGRYRQSGSGKVSITGKVAGEEQRLTIDADLAGAGIGGSYTFIERLWATRRIASIIDQIDLKGQNKELVDELVALSKQYGILTPYTSFLADENVSVADAGALRLEADKDLLTMDSVSGAGGVAQRAAKGEMSKAVAAPPASADAQLHMYARAMPAERQKAKLSGDSMRQIGAKTFYRRSGRWIDAAIADAKDQKPIVIRQFSDEYFRLVAGQSSTANGYLNFKEPVTVQLGTQVYSIEPEK